MKGLSGAVTALILVIASVVIALIVVGFAFGLFGTFSSQNAVTNLGSAYIQYNPSTGIATIYVNLNNPGSTNVQIASVSLQSIPMDIVAANQYTITQGTNSLTISVSAPPGATLNLQPGEQVTVQITLTNNQVVTVPATVTVT